MKYELETIPIWDTYKLDTECPLCHLEERALETYVEYYLGNSVMIPETRVEVNKTGFCPAHYTCLFESGKNRHGLGLVTHTHLKEETARLQTHFKRIKAAAGGSGEEKLPKILERFTGYVDQFEHSCLICDRIEYTLERYAFTIAYLWKKDEEFKQAFGESRGFCIRHLPFMIGMAKKVLRVRPFREWLGVVMGLQEKSFERLDGEVEWFTQKFDFQNNGKPWGTSKDALHRGIQKLTGRIQKDRK